jgi:oxaloacetate decarboxylase alpha subunit
VHTEEYFVGLAKRIEDMGADLVCIKDMANLLLPYPAYSLVKKLKESVKVPIVLHTHNTTGTGDMTLLKAIEAGVDIVDTALSPLGSGTSQPATESLVATLKGTEYDTGLDLELLSQAAELFRPVAKRLTDDGWRNPGVMAVDANTLRYQVPGGMLSNLIGQLRQANQMDKYYQVLAEIPYVREDFGYPPLVTPTSQIVGTQAVMNVISGERYKMVPNESKALLLGDTPIIEHRPADDLKPELETYRSEISEYIQQDEDVLSYALFPQVALKFFQTRQAKELKADPTLFDEKTGVMPV